MNTTGKGGFQPGESGNPRGRPKGQGLTDELSLLIDKKKLAEKIIWLAMEKNDIRAIMYIYDRVDGKPSAYFEMESPDTERIMTFWQEIRGEADRIRQTGRDTSSISDRAAEDIDS